MKRFFEEHTSVIIICIVISILLCIIGSVRGISSSETSVEGSGLLKIVGDNLTDTIDTFQTQAVPNKNLVTYNNFNFIYWDYSISNGLYADFQKEEKIISGKKTTIYNIPTKANVGNYFYSGLQAFIIPTSDDENETKTYTFSFNVSADKKVPFSFIGINNSQLIYSSLKTSDEYIDSTPKKVIVTFKTRTHCKSNYNIHWSLRDDVKDDKVKIMIDSIKLEEGTKATPFEN